MKNPTKKQSRKPAAPRCEACSSPHADLRPDRRAKRLGVGHLLCTECRAFVAEVSDEDYKWVIAHAMRD